MSDQAQQSLPIHDLKSELALLCCLIGDPAAAVNVSRYMRPEHFYLQRARQAYAGFMELSQDGNFPDFPAWERHLHEAHGDGSILIEAQREFPIMTPPPSSISDHAFAIINAYKRRGYVQAGRSLVQQASDFSVPIETVDEQALGGATDVYLSADTKNTMVDGDGLASLLSDDIGKAQAGELVFYETGYADLDRHLEGIEEGSLIVLGARPGMGKTALQCGISLRRLRAGKAIAFFSLEMSAIQLGYRMMAEMSGINAKKIRRGQLTHHETQTIDNCLKAISGFSLFIDDNLPMTPNYITAQSRRISQQRGALDLIMIDYLQIMEADSQYRSMESETAGISRKLKTLAKSLGTPVFTAAQLSRSVETRQDKHPQLADLRNSGAIEQDADYVFFIYRDEYYNPDTTERPNIAEIMIAKNRHGPTGVVDLYWHPQLASFKNLIRSELQL